VSYCIIYRNNNRTIKIIMSNMKRNIIILAGIFLSVFTASAQVDRTKAPASGPAPKIQIGKYESFTLKNGLRVFVVENHKLPMVTYSLLLDNDPILQGEKTGYVEMVGELLTSGTKTRNKEQLDEEIDFIGATISASPTGLYATSLKKHNEKLLELMSDILLNPSFPAEEFEKIKTQSISALAASKTDPSSISQNLQNVLTYGSNHPYGEVVTEQTLANITIDDIRNYYTSNFIPNVGYLAIVGDITKAEIQPLIEKYLGGWVKGTPVKNKYATPQQPGTPHIHMHDRPGSVQTSMSFVYPVTLKIGDPDFIKTRLLGGILGGGSTGRLYKNLREGHGYTYGAYASIQPDKLVGEFYAGAEVRNSVTDSAIYQFIYELNRIHTQGITKEELDAVKKELTGTFARSLENPQTVANFAINIERYKLAKDYYETYLTTLNAITVEEMNDVAKRYVLPYNFHLVLVGSRDSVEKNILQYDGDQKISYYDNYGKPAKQLKDAPAGVTAETVIDTYVKTIGGSDAIAKIQDITVKGSANMQGYPVEMLTVKKNPDKYYMMLSAGGQTMQLVVSNGKEGKVEGMQGSANMTAEELADMKYEAPPVFEAVYKTLNVQATLLGVDYVNDKDAYLVEFVYPNKSKVRTWFDAKSGLKVKETSYEDGGQVTTWYSDFRPVNGVLMPYILKQEVGGMTIDASVNTIEVNTGVKDDFFAVKK